MNEGTLAILIIVTTIGAAIWATLHRDLAYPRHPPATPTAPAEQRAAAAGAARPPRRRRVAPAARPRQARRARPMSAPSATLKQPEAVSAPVSGVCTPHIDPEMLAFQLFAKLVRAGVITETVLLEHAFDVRAGSSKAYKAVHAKLKRAQAELGACTPTQTEKEQAPSMR